MKGTGLLEEDAELVGAENVSRPLASIVGAVGRPTSVRYDGLLDKILDQGLTNSCVGCAFSTAIYLRGQLTTPVKRPAPKIFYDLARMAYGGVDVRDEGCRPIDAIRMTSDQGMVSEEEWPLFTDDPEFLRLAPSGREWINTLPTFDVFHSAYDARLTGYFRADFGDIVGLLEGALAIGQIPAFGMKVAPDYSDVKGEIYDAPRGIDPGTLPGHMQALVGYDADSFLVASSWGLEHGSNGIVRIAKSFIADPRWCHSRIVITSSPKVVS